MSKKQKDQNSEPRHHKYFEDQFDDEDVLMVFRKHPVVMRKGLVIASFGLLVGPVYTFILTYARPNNPPSVNFFFLSVLAGFVLAALLFFPWWLSWHYSVFIITNQRLIQITQKGLFHRSIVGINLNQIQMINYEISGLQETLLGFGTIMIQTFVGSLTIHEVHHPAKIQKEMLQILREEGITTAAPPMLDQDEEAQEA
jgi:uncharacterized membrane protein YdbT with pleckstrin-like domain